MKIPIWLEKKFYLNFYFPFMILLIKLEYKIKIIWARVFATVAPMHFYNKYKDK